MKSVFDLTRSEKLQLVEDLWDDIASQSANVPVHEWQKAELDRRKARLSAGVLQTLSWQEVQHRVRNLYGGET